jgi:hypothetical protein
VPHKPTAFERNVLNAKFLSFEKRKGCHEEENPRPDKKPNFGFPEKRSVAGKILP